MLKRTLLPLVVALAPLAALAQQKPAPPSLNSPKCVRVPEARGEEAADEELGVGRNGEYCAYPLRMMAYHRIVNDHLGGPPILVSYDPDSGAGRVFDPVLDGKPYTFDATGSRDGLPALKDRETGSSWSALTGEALAGPLAGKRLARIPALILTWSRWKALHSDSWVLAEDTALSPHYVARTTAPTCPLPASVTRGDQQRVDARLAGDTLTLGMADGKAAAALPLTDRRGRYPEAASVREERLGKEKVVLFLDPGAHAAAAFTPIAEGQALHFNAHPETQPPHWTDRETGSTWTVEGNCTSGSLKGAALAPADAVRARWYAWSALHPQSAVLRSR